MKVLSSRLLPPPPIDKPRTGVHLSDVIKFILVQKDAATYGKKAGAGDRLRWESGYLWEIVFSQAMAHREGLKDKDLRVQQPKTKDGIVTTLDLFDAKNHVVKEFKWTMLSASHSVMSSKLWHYLVQVKAYAFVWDTDRADLLIHHAMGDYSRPADGGLPEPVVYEHQLKFNLAELEQTWRMILTNRDAMLEERRLKGGKRG